MAAINKNIVVASVALPLDEEEQTRKKRRTCTIWTRSCPANIRLDEDVLKTSCVFVFRRRLDQDEYVRLSLTSSEDVFKTSWSRPIYSSWLYVFKTSSRRFQDVFETSCKSVFKKSSRCLQDVFKTSSKRLQDIFKTSSRRIIKLNCSC